MKVTLIDYTGAGTPNPARHAANLLVFTKLTRLAMRPTLINEIAGWSEEKVLEELAYMANTIPSSWEFVTYTFLVNDVTRGFTHQFVRTRTASFAQQTMRVLNVDGWKYGTGPTVADDACRKSVYDGCMFDIGTAYNRLIDSGAKIEDARGVLPTNIHTNIVAKFDLRALVGTVRKRASSRAQGEYRDVLAGMREEVLRVHPWSSLFLDRTADRAATELDAMIQNLPIDAFDCTTMIKLVDQLRGAQ